MPIAVITENEEKCMLKSCPPDGYVIIKKMNYGQSLERQDMIAEIAMQMPKDKRVDPKMEIKFLQQKTALWEFANLILDHNLTDASQRKLNFQNPADVMLLQGPIGDEIQRHVNRLNSFEDDEEIKNLQSGSDPQS